MDIEWLSQGKLGDLKQMFIHISADILVHHFDFFFFLIGMSETNIIWPLRVFFHFKKTYNLKYCDVYLFTCFTILIMYVFNYF